VRVVRVGVFADVPRAGGGTDGANRAAGRPQGGGGKSALVHAGDRRLRARQPLPRVGQKRHQAAAAGRQLRGKAAAPRTHSVLRFQRTRRLRPLSCKSSPKFAFFKLKKISQIFLKNNFNLQISLSSVRPASATEPEMMAALRPLHAKFHKWHISSPYSLYLQISDKSVRREVIIEGSNSIKGPWMEYNFRYKPGNVNRSLPVISELLFSNFLFVKKILVTLKNLLLPNIDGM